MTTQETAQEPQKKAQDRPVYPSVDILRGLAAVSVVVYHVIEILRWTRFPTDGPLLWFRIGWMSLTLFFVLSGFVIATSVFAGIDRRGPRGFRTPYVRNRLARIVPLHYLTLVVFVAVVTPELVRRADFGWQAISHLLFLHNFSGDTFGAVNGPNWSVAVEIQFYLLIAVLAPMLRVARWWYLAVSFVGCAWAWRAFAASHVSITGPDGVLPMFQLSYQLPGCLDEFVAGILLARYLRWRRGRTSRAEIGSAVVATVFLWWLALHLYWDRAVYWNDPLMVTFFRTLLACACVGLVYLACCARGPLWLELTRPLRYLGEISYGIYLWHIPVLLTVQKLELATVERALLITLTATILLASASWHLLERPAMRRLGRTRPDRQPAP